MLTLEKKQTMKYKMIDCRSCGSEMPELRLTQYGYNMFDLAYDYAKGEGMKHYVT